LGVAHAVTALLDRRADFYDQFRMSYRPPPWSALAVPVNWTAKAKLAAQLPGRDAVVWVASNCDSRCGREGFVQELMEELAVDSFGLCLNNRDAGPLGMAPDKSNFHTVLGGKVQLLRPYRFALVQESSVEPDYVSEKLFDAW
jgi:hypothetical protein